MTYLNKKKLTQKIASLEGQQFSHESPSNLKRHAAVKERLTILRDILDCLEEPTDTCPPKCSMWNHIDEDGWVAGIERLEKREEAHAESHKEKWRMIEELQATNERYREALESIARSEQVDTLKGYRCVYNDLIDTAQKALKDV